MPKGLSYAPAVTDGELAVRQYLLKRCQSTKFNSAVLVAGDHGKVKWPLPPDWFDLIESYGITLHRPSCRCRWWLFCVLHVGYGVWLAIKEFGKAMKGRGAYPTNMDKSAQFFAVLESHLPTDTGPPRENLLTWYIQRPDRPEWMHQIVASGIQFPVRKYGSVAVVPMQNPFIPLRVFPAVRLLGWSLTAAFTSLIDLLRGHWWDALLFAELVAYQKFSRLPNHDVAAEYIFDHSTAVYKPLWTNLAKQRGIGSILYFYSTNSFGFVDSNQNRYPDPAYRIMNWDRVWVWNQQHKTMVHELSQRVKVVSHSTLECCGHIPFADTGEPIPRVKGRRVAVFDVSPTRPSIYWVLGQNTDYYVSEIVTKFLNDIAEVTEELSMPVIFKRKRDLGNFYHKSYKLTIEALSMQNHWHEVPPTVAASRLVKEADIIISLPFTSTALIGVHFSRPSVYYDPTETILGADEAALGVEVLKGKLSLRRWLEKELAK